MTAEGDALYERVLGASAPDVAGLTATCETCGTSIGPVEGFPGASVRLGCPCGTVLEVWPE